MNEIDDIVGRLETEVKTLPEKKNQCVQHLIELGYIPLSKVNALLPADIERAKVAFFEEARESGLYEEHELMQHVFLEEEEFLAGLLDKATDIDEGFTFKSLPEKGERNLITRIIHYRLDLFGMWEQPVDIPYSIIYSLAKIDEIAGFIQAKPLDTINLLADIEDFTKKLLQTHKEEAFILTFRSRNLPNESLINKLDRRGKFKRQLVEDFGERSDFFKYLRNEVLKNNVDKIDFDFLRKESIDPFKRFLLRLIQVHQWQDGMYDGLLDSDIGEVTLQSIVNSVELYNLADNRQIKLFRVLTYVHDGYFLFNALFFLQEYMLEEDSETPGRDAEGTIVNDLLNSTQQAGNPALAAFGLQMDVMKKELRMASEQQPEERMGFLKRIYFGFKKFFRKVVKFSKKIFHWVVSLYEKFKDILKKLFGNFFGKLAKGIKAFVEGIKFLLGRKSTTTYNEKGLISSVIRVDGDSYNIVTGDSKTLYQKHTEKIRYSVTSLNFALTIVGGVVNIVSRALSVLSWPMLIFSIIKVFKTISEAYQKIEFTTT